MLGVQERMSLIVLGEAEIEDLDDPIEGYHQVGRLEIAVDQAGKGPMAGVLEKLSVLQAL